MQDQYIHKGMRKQLVKEITKKGIQDKRVLAAIGHIPRHYFFDSALISHAYQDKAFPIGEGQTISQPYTVAFQTTLLDVQPGDKILEVGTGSGYQCCVLMALGAKVYTIEYNKKLYLRAKKLLPKMGFRPQFFLGDGSKGIPGFAPFDKIIVTAGAPSVPQSLLQQLNENGRLIIPVGNAQQQKMLRLIKIGNQVQEEVFSTFKFVPLVGENGW